MSSTTGPGSICWYTFEKGNRFFFMGVLPFHYSITASGNCGKEINFLVLRAYRGHIGARLEIWQLVNAYTVLGLFYDLSRICFSLFSRFVMDLMKSRSFDFERLLNAKFAK